MSVWYALINQLLSALLQVAINWSVVLASNTLTTQFNGLRCAKPQLPHCAFRLSFPSSPGPFLAPMTAVVPYTHDAAA